MPRRNHKDRVSSFYSEIGTLCDGSVVNHLGQVRAFRVAAGPRNTLYCSFEPPLDIAMTDTPPSPCAVVASGRTCWIQLTTWGLKNGVPHAEGVVVKTA